MKRRPGSSATALTWCALGLVFMIILLLPVSSWAHGFAGKRFFPTTFQVDDPFISDEFSVLIDRIKGPDAKTTEIDIDYSKRILPNFGLEFHEAYVHLKNDDGSTANGWDNLGIGAKWQFLTNAEHETILSIGTDFDIGGTGAHQIADSFTTISPAFFFGKGLGDLPESVKYLRPFAVTGVVGPNFPTRSGNASIDPDTGQTVVERNPTTLTWAFSVQYSLMYLQSFVKDIGLGAPFNRMILVTEFPMETCMSADCKGKITGTVNPGVVWAGKFTEFGIAAQIPVNSRSGRAVGVLGLIHLYIDDLFPKSIGAPIFH
ncbi:MAG TPA: hypothetical protein VFG09_01110 [Thermodesulfovibrionales bacterium]|nr:hypothetical protein [Thermodesulfovibrionales bacterium]